VKAKRADVLRRRSGPEATRQFAEICRRHKVVVLDWAPNRCAPTVKFAGATTKAMDAEIEAWIRERGLTDPALIRFVRAVMTRRKKYVNWVNDLFKAGLVPAPAAA